MNEIISYFLVYELIYTQFWVYSNRKELVLYQSPNAPSPQALQFEPSFSYLGPFPQNLSCEQKASQIPCLFPMTSTPPSLGFPDLHMWQGLKGQTTSNEMIIYLPFNNNV